MKTDDSKLVQKSRLNKKRKRHINFGTRLAINIIMFLIFMILGIYMFINSIYIQNQENIFYDEKSNIDYRVYLTENDFYEKDYLDKNMIYVSNLIDKIDVTFDYDFTIEKKEDIDFTYNIIGKLIISDSTGKRNYFDKDYTLVDNKKMSMKNNTKHKITEQISLDYSYYNSLANKFKLSYGIDTKSKLVVYMNINKQTINKLSPQINNSNEMNIVVPLSEKSIEINLDYKEINTSNIVKTKEGLIIKNIKYLCLSIIFIIISLILLKKAIKKMLKLTPKKTYYDKYVEKILKEYDRLIAETKNIISFDNKEIINITNFSELVDIHDNLRQPIMYYVVNQHQKSYFYIAQENIVYLYVVKAIDIEEKYGKNR